MSKNISKIKKIYRAAIYLRLSKEDGDVADAKKAESNSISNQRILIQDFLKDKDDIEVGQFVKVILSGNTVSFMKVYDFDKQNIVITKCSLVARL